MICFPANLAAVGELGDTLEAFTDVFQSTCSYQCIGRVKP